MVSANCSIAGKVYWATEELQSLLSPVADIVFMESTSREELFSDFAAPDGRYSRIVCIYHEHLSQPIVGMPNAEFVRALPDSCKWIAHKGAGYEAVDVAACGERGIGVSNTPGAVDEATATTALYLLIATARQFSQCEAHLRAGGFAPLPQVEATSFDLEGRTLGILGAGGIGLRFGEMAAALRMKIVYHNRKPSPKAPKEFKYCESMEEMLANVDMLSVHVPLSKATEKLIGEKEIRTMKKGSIIINTARGKVIDEEAMIKALQDGHVSLRMLLRRPQADDTVRAARIGRLGRVRIRAQA